MEIYDLTDRPKRARFRGFLNASFATVSAILLLISAAVFHEFFFRVGRLNCSTNKLQTGLTEAEITRAAGSPGRPVRPPRDWLKSEYAYTKEWANQHDRLTVGFDETGRATVIFWTWPN